jgi:hypothetical protein
LFPQVAAPLSWQLPVGSGWPSGTFEQRPIEVGSAHDLHALAQPVAQQTPCAQFPDEHSCGSAQKAPFGLRPHELSAQTRPLTHWTSLVQAVKQRVPLHANGAQLVASGTAQRPLSLHVAGAV